jgi:hypothetical protein
MRGGESAQQELVAPPLPDGFGYLVLWFNELHRRRQSGPNGPQPLVWSEIESWARQTGRTLSQWELRVLTMLDDAYFAATFGAETQETAPVVARAESPWPAQKGAA